MSTTIHIASEQTVGSVITDRHFGLNFVADYERIGTKSWERFDDIVLRLNAAHVRYPGGVAAETVFDYRNPNRTEVTLESGEKVRLTPLSTYIEFCNLHQINPTIIIPTSSLLGSRSELIHRDFDTSQVNDLKLFVESVLHQVDPSLTLSFELGNEYEGYMTSTEYGRVASALTAVIDDVHLEQCSQNQHAYQRNEPQIYVQSWAYSVGGGLSPNDIFNRNVQVIAQFDPETINRINGVVSHYYYLDGRNQGNAYEQSFERIAPQIDAISNLHREWEVASGKELDSRISEWNVSFRSTEDLGLKQISPMMQMFASFLSSGFDALDFWSTQYHATSAATSSGRLMAAGTVLDILQANVLGTALSAASTGQEVGVYSFVGASKQVAVVTSQVDEAIAIDLEHSTLPTDSSLVGGFIIGVDEATADGNFKELSGLPAFGDPDAKITVSHIPMSIISGTGSSLGLDPFECVILIFVETNPILENVFGTDYSDYLYSAGLPSQFIGGGGWDMVLYIQSAMGVDVHLGNDGAKGPSSADTFHSIEAILGSNFSDRIAGSNEGDLLSGWMGDDVLIGGLGNDTLFGGEGNDQIFGGSGDDSLVGEDGDDVFFTGIGNDTVFGGLGNDTINLSDCQSGVAVWEQARFVETRGGSVRFSGIESFIGTDFNDRFVFSDGGTTVDAGDGNDTFQLLGNGSYILSGSGGDDFVQTWDAHVEFFGGNGADSLLASSSGGSFFGGQGNDRATVFGNNWVLDGGEGDDVFHITGSGNKYILSARSGHDTVVGFNLATDVIELVDLTAHGAEVFDDHGSALLILGEDVSLRLAGVAVQDLFGCGWFSADWL